MTVNPTLRPANCFPRFLSRWSVAAIAVAAAAGCSSEPKLPEPVAVSGKITSATKPLDSVTVGFAAISKGLPAKYRYAQAVTNAEGAYSIPAVYPGEYLVTLTKGTGDANADPQKVSVNPADPELAKFGPDSPLRANVSAAAKTFDFDTRQK